MPESLSCGRGEISADAGQIEAKALAATHALLSPPQKPRSAVHIALEPGGSSNTTKDTYRLPCCCSASMGGVLGEKYTSTRPRGGGGGGGGGGPLGALQQTEETWGRKKGAGGGLRSEKGPKNASRCVSPASGTPSLPLGRNCCHGR